jgi:hypothetical protein
MDTTTLPLLILVASSIHIAGVLIALLVLAAGRHPSVETRDAAPLNDVS